ncbi:hypothetical protein HPCPY1124_0859 [Helicobacter pylori CPY1124]|nr:hypothetical protein HPCPY1124_0859 [Helicobacter pylori CPY1124]
MLVKKINTPKSTQIKAPIITTQDMNFLVKKKTLYFIESIMIELIKYIFLFLE